MSTANPEDSPGPHVAALDDLDARTWHDLVQLRVDVFVVEQHCPYPELDGRDVDPATRHVWETGSDAEVAGYLRLLTEPDGVRRIGRVCVAPRHRSTGVAGRLMRRALQECGETVVVLDAQSYLAGWYTRLGFSATGPEFVEDGIPHVPMRRG